MSKWSSAWRSPMWQQKRLEIMQRDEFTCQSCQSTDKTLNVHHIYYEKNKAPWDYDNDMLITWCEDCHTKRHEMQKEILVFMSGMDIENLTSLGFLVSEVPHVLNIVKALYMDNWKDASNIDDVLIKMIKNFGEFKYA